MPKLTLNTIGSRYASVAALNDNFDLIEAALENTLSRDGTSPNPMLADLDMNNKKLLNVSETRTNELYINGELVEPTAGVTAAAAFQTYTFTATAGQTTFSIFPATPQLASIEVFVNGLSIHPSEISVSGSNIIIPALTVGDEVVVRRYTKEPTYLPTADQVTYQPSGVNATTRTVQSKLRETVSVKDFGAVGNGVTNDTTAIQNAINTGNRVVLPDGNYLVGTLTLVNNVQIVGSGKLVSTDLGAVITGTSVSGFLISCRFKGGNVAQYGVSLTNCSDFAIDSSEFDGFGSSGSFHGAVQIVGSSTNFRVTNNLIKNGLGSTAADISIGGSVNGGVVTSNRCVSANSEGITVQMTSPNPARLTVSNNYCAGHTRHGILGVYDNGKPTQVTYSANVCFNNGWSGIYLQGQTAGVGNDSGQVSCIGNVCVANGGTDSSALFNSGIYVAGDLGYSIVGNTVINSGYDSSGAARAYDTHGIFASNLQNATISENNIRNSKTYGILFTGTTTVGETTIASNAVVDSGTHQIFLVVNGASSVCRNIVVIGNQLSATNTDPHGIYFNTSSTAEWRDFIVQSNKITGRKAGTTKYGIRLFAATVSLIRGDIFSNTIFNYDTGVFSGSSQAHLAYGGKNIRIKDNSLISCTEGINVPTNSAAWGLIDYNIYNANGTDVVGTWVRRGRITEFGSVEMYDTAAPSFAAWEQGDRVWNTTPAAGGVPGWICTTAGTPGTWKAMASLAP